MTPEQLRALADRFEQSEPPPYPGDVLAQYTASMTAHRMARFLREIADDEEPEPRPL